MENVTFDTWENEMFNTVMNVFTTHSIKINMENDKNISRAEEGRAHKIKDCY